MKYDNIKNNINFNFINKILNQNNKTKYELIKIIYDNNIEIINEQRFNSLFVNTEFIEYKKINVYEFYLHNVFKKEISKNIFENIIHLKNIKNEVQEIEKSFQEIKKNILFVYYNYIFENKNLNKDDLVYYLLKNNFELDFNKFIELYDDINLDYIKKYKKLENFYISYIKNYKRINIILSIKLINKIYNIDYNFIKIIYKQKLLNNKINIDSNLDIGNFYHKNNNLLKNEEDFYNKYNIDVHFIKNIYQLTNIYEIIKLVIQDKIIINQEEFMKKYKDSNVSLISNVISNLNSNYEYIKNIIHNEKISNSLINQKHNTNQEIIDYDFIISYYNFENFNLEDIELIIKSNPKLIINTDNFIKENNINFELIRLLNHQLMNKNNAEITKELLLIDKNKINNENKNNINNQNKILKNYQDFNNFYIDLVNSKNIYLNQKYKSELIKIIKNIQSNEELLNFIKYKNYLLSMNKNYISRKNVFFIEEVLLDLDKPKPKLEDGISLIIRAKNEELNIRLCIESVIDLVDEVIFVNNNSTDNTLKIIEELENKYIHLKVYNYFINVNKVGVEHEEAIKTGNKNTLGNFYNWCLSKSTKKNIIKWDADFICIRHNFKELINNYQIKNKNTKYALWFSGCTLFINKDSYYLNLESYYNEYRLFSYANGFQWYDGNLCEYNEPYINQTKEKIHINYPIFYEMKRTNENEFESRSSLIDQRDITDYNILKQLNNSTQSTQSTYSSNLYKINEKLINKQLNILLITSTLNIGGSNIFICGLYKYFKLLGFNIKIYAESIVKKIKKFNTIDNYDIYQLNNELIHQLNNQNKKQETQQQYDYIIFNGYIPNIFNDNFMTNHLIKKIFVTHSDVSWSNYFIKKYYNNFHKIITVNNYTINKINKFVVNENQENQNQKMIKIINYVEQNQNQQNQQNQQNKIKNKKFGMISRFSEDKNVIMLLYALKSFFNIYTDYQFYLVGFENNNIQNYLTYMIEYLDLKKHVILEGYKENVEYYYHLFDFIILPSVSEGASYNLMESMNYKKLIIASNVGGNYELLGNDCIYIEYSSIREFESNHLYIENYNKQLNLIGYYTINNIEEFNNDYHVIKNINNQFPFIQNIPSLLIQYKGLNKNKESELNKLKNTWQINCNNIFNSLIQVINMNIDEKEKLIENNYNKIIHQYNKNNYYKNINTILDLDKN
jgi:hypothetical protein